MINGLMTKLQNGLALTGAQQTKVNRTAPLLASVLGGQPVWTARDLKTYYKEGFNKNLVAYRAITSIAWSAACIRIKAVDSNGDEVRPSDPVARILRRPNPGMSQVSYWRDFYAYLKLTGNNYTNSEGPQDGMRDPVWLYIQRPDRMKVVPSALGIGRYEYYYSGKKLTWDVNQSDQTSAILHTKEFNPGGDWYGLSPLEPAAMSVDQHNEANAWNMNMLQNQGRLGGLMNIDSSGLTPQQEDELEKHIQHKLTGKRNAGGVAVFSREFKFQELGISPKDMDWIQGKNVNARDIATALNYPALLLGIPGDNTYSNYAEARLALYEDSILPMVDWVIEDFEHFLLPKYTRTDAVALKYDLDDIPALAPRRESRWERIAKSDWITKNEKRDATGYDASDQDGMDLVYQSGINVPVGSEDEFGMSGMSNTDQAKAALMDLGYSDTEIKEYLKHGSLQKIKEYLEPPKNA